MRLMAGIHDRWTHVGGVPQLTFLGAIAAQTALIDIAIILPTYGALVAIDGNLGDYFRIVVTDGVAFTISNPTNLRIGQPVTIEIQNVSGGAHGAVTLGANYRASAAIPAIATGFNRKFVFEALTVAILSEVARTAADVAN